MAIPKKRLPEQRYVMVLREAPWPDMIWINQRYFSQNFFNWTWTYRFDSDLLNPLAFIVHKRDTSQLKKVQSVIGSKSPNKLSSLALDMSRKNKLVFWVVSNCQTRFDP